MAKGTAIRKAREKEALRELILQAAKKLFVEKGIVQTTIRNIADAVDYSIGTIYVYFKDKNEILHALHTQGFALLGGKMAVLFEVEDPMARLKAMGKVYLRFAQENPEMYDLMFTLRAPMEFLNEVNREEWNEGKATFELLRVTVKNCQEAGHFKGHKLEPLTFLIWGAVHGICSLEIGNRSKGVNLKKPGSVLHDAYEELVSLIDQR